MAVKLIKACKELNIGMSTLTQWCESNGFEVESDPNYRLSDDLYSRLEQQFKNIDDKGVDGVRFETVTNAYGKIIPKVVVQSNSQLESKHRDKDEKNNPCFRYVRDSNESWLKDVPFSYGIVQLFRDGHYGYQVYGLVKNENGDECFYHVNNCQEGETIIDGDLVFYKAAIDKRKGRMTAYMVRHPKEEDGFTFIFEHFWKGDIGYRKIASSALVRALQSYSTVHWAKSGDYADILLDTKPYLLECEADYTFEQCCKTLVKVKSLGQSDEINANFLLCLSKYILPDIESNKLVHIFHSFFTHKEILLGIIEQIEDFVVKAKAVEAFFTGDYRNDAEFIMAMESHNVAEMTCSRFRDCYASQYADLEDEEKAWLYISNFDLSLRDRISDEAIVKTLENCDDDTIVQFYNTHIEEAKLVVKACAVILREHSGWDGSSACAHMNRWETSMSQLVDDIIQETKKVVDGKYVKLWRCEIVPAPSKDEWLRMMLNDNQDPIRGLNEWFKFGYIDKNLAEEIMHDWYISKLESTKDMSEERFAFDYLLLRKFKELDIKFNVPKHDSEYLSVIEWYENYVKVDSEDKKIEFDQLSKYFYLFSEYEQVKILRYIFYLMESNFISKSLEPLLVLTSKNQQLQHNNKQIHVCFDVDLVIEAMLKFQVRKEFFVERDILSLLLTSLTNEDFRERSHPLIYQLFDECGGIEWRKYKDEYDDRGKYIGKRRIERNYGRPHGVIFCEGRELEKKDEMGNTRYWCRNTYCAKNRLVFHSDWKEYTMYDFCHIMGFDMSEVDYAGHRCVNGKYLKFVTLINRFNQFAKHLFCRECGRLMMPSMGLTNLGVSVSSHYECINSNCIKKGLKIYLSHCLNPDCQEPIDERDTKKCPNGWVICGRCATCCSHQVFSRRLSFLQEHRPDSIPLSLKRAVENHIGHLERDEIYCPQCGSKLEMIIGRSDLDYACTNKVCGATFLLEKLHRNYRLSAMQQDE
ncbi:MAG: hypothetical protein IKX20_07190 [Paludibacteraceae bacterium]|nr:hypothetical protein [Paludibacteraceae bacterium]